MKCSKKSDPQDPQKRTPLFNGSRKPLFQKKDPKRGVAWLLFFLEGLLVTCNLSFFVGFPRPQEPQQWHWQCHHCTEGCHTPRLWSQIPTWKIAEKQRFSTINQCCCFCLNVIACYVFCWGENDESYPKDQVPFIHVASDSRQFS